MTPDLTKLIEEGKKVSAAATRRPTTWWDSNQANKDFLTRAANTFDARTEIIETLVWSLAHIEEYGCSAKGMDTRCISADHAREALTAANEIAKRCGGG